MVGKQFYLYPRKKFKYKISDYNKEKVLICQYINSSTHKDANNTPCASGEIRGNFLQDAEIKHLAIF